MFQLVIRKKERNARITLTAVKREQRYYTTFTSELYYLNKLKLFN